MIDKKLTLKDFREAADPDKPGSVSVLGEIARDLLEVGERHFVHVQSICRGKGIILLQEVLEVGLGRIVTVHDLLAQLFLDLALFGNSLGQECMLEIQQNLGLRLQRDFANYRENKWERFFYDSVCLINLS